MISLNKIFYGLFILMLVAGIYTYQLMWFKSSDELITLLLALLCVLDILSNKNHRRYKGLFGRDNDVLPVVFVGWRSL